MLRNACDPQPMTAALISGSSTSSPLKPILGLGTPAKTTPLVQIPMSTPIPTASESLVCAVVDANVGLGFGLGDIARLSHARTRSISPENPTGDKGRGGAATEGTGAAF